MKPFSPDSDLNPLIILKQQEVSVNAFYILSFSLLDIESEWCTFWLTVLS